MMKTKSIILIGIIALLGSCNYDKEEVAPAKNDNSEESSVCDSVDATFAAVVLPLLKEKCAPCHVDGGSSGGFAWDTYEVIEANQEILLKAIKHESGVLNMPLNRDKLSDEDIQKVECWINNGALNN